MALIILRAVDLAAALPDSLFGPSAKLLRLVTSAVLASFVSRGRPILVSDEIRFTNDERRPLLSLPLPGGNAT
ncbi:MAG: hypothetical protein LZF60_230114 [Nitrospira sp.]|nr:MAG: hypothetical protein LZF60_230114 [Nitrospira sp.]